jgi:histone deacetylase 1/2
MACRQVKHASSWRRLKGREVAVQDRVLCVSFHRFGDGFFPGSGGSNDVGEGAGKHHTVNIPTAQGLTDDELESLFVPIVTAAAEHFQPHALILVAGAGLLAGDRLGCMNLTLDGYGHCVQTVAALGRPLLVLGGGGYNQVNAARAWCHATATLCGVSLPDELPPHDFYEYYTPSLLCILPTAMVDQNTSESLSTVRKAALDTIAQVMRLPLCAHMHQKR